MENNETWRDRFDVEFSNVGWVPKNKARILAFISAELLTLADKIGAKNRESINSLGDIDGAWVNGFNSGLDTAISIIKEMAK